MRRLFPFLIALTLCACSAPAGWKPRVMATHADLVLMAHWEALAAQEEKQGRSDDILADARTPEGQARLDVMRGRRGAVSENELIEARRYIKAGIDAMTRARESSGRKATP